MTWRATARSCRWFPRPVVIHDFVLTEQLDGGHSVFEAECGKGTYVRALARDMGRLLGCYGHISVRSGARWSAHLPKPT